MYLVVLLYQYASKSDTEQTASSATAIMNQMKNETTRVWAKKKVMIIVNGDAHVM